MPQKSDILTLENLQKEYDNTMILYIQAQENYNSALNSIDKKKYVTIPQKTYWGTTAIQQKNVSKIEDCTALCSNDLSCKGATFDSKDNTCWTRTGNSSLTSGTSTQSAIISEFTNATLNLQNLNNKLLLLNDKITNYNFENFTNISTVQDELNTDISANSRVLKNEYDLLIVDRTKIKEILEKNSKIDVDYKNMKLYNNQNRIYYTLWTFLAFVFIIIIVKMVIYPEMNINWGSFVLYTILAAVLLLLVHFLKSANVFFIFVLIILCVGVLMSFLR
jgi:membrane-associated HD superfamily phosphohydrolase